MKNYIIILALIITSSCAVCPPQKDVINGKAAQRHDLKKFRATYHKVGSLYVIRYENEQELRKETTKCKPNFVNGSWMMINQIHLSAPQYPLYIDILKLKLKQDEKRIEKTQPE